MKTEADYAVPEQFIHTIASTMGEFRPGGTMLTVELKNGENFESLVVSNCKWFIGGLGTKDIPFDVKEIERVYQRKEDEWPKRSEIPWEPWELGYKAAGLK